MPDLVSLQQLKRELRLPDSTEEDDVLARKLAEAQELCLHYVDQRKGDDESEEWSETIAGWTADTAPAQVTAAILELAVALWRFRGDDEKPPKWYDDGVLPGGVRMKLDRHRDPAIA
jgi:ubiquinone biosynthesis protein COQ9